MSSTTRITVTDNSFIDPEFYWPFNNCKDINGERKTERDNAAVEFSSLIANECEKNWNNNLNARIWDKLQKSIGDVFVDRTE